MVESFVEGVRWGVWLLGAITPIAVLIAVSVTLFRLLSRETFVVGELVEDDEDLPDLDFDFEKDPETFKPEVFSSQCLRSTLTGEPAAPGITSRNRATI